MGSRIVVTSIATLALSLTACGGGGGGSDPDPGTDGGGGGNQDVQVEPTLTSIQDNIFTPICSVCHGGANPAAGQDLSSRSATIASLINVQSSNPDFLRVEPGNADESYLYLKITGDSRAGARMPLNRSPLSSQQISAIRQWIDDGALTLGQNEPVTIAQTQVNRHGQALEFNVSLTDSLDLNSINEYSINIFANYGHHKVQINSPVISFNATSSAFKASVILPAERANSIELELNNPNWTTVLSSKGEVLDGDKDGKPGGIYRYEHKFED